MRRPGPEHSPVAPGRAKLVVVLLFPLVAACALTRKPPRAPEAAEPAHAVASKSEPPLSRPEPAGATEASSHEEPDPIDDGFDLPPNARAEAFPRREHPLAHLGERELAKLLSSDPEALGSMSIGRPSAGALFNGVAMPQGDHWDVVDAHGAWGTEETVVYLTRAIESVYERYPSSDRLSIGHISDEDGGHLSPHVSHQSGRDVDMSYFYSKDARWYKRANESNLDAERTWALVRALVVETDVELILMDYSIQRLLRKHAESIGEDAAWLDGLFSGKGEQRPLIRHARGHATHMHIRFYNPIAQETARRCASAMVQAGIISAPVHYVYHLARRGDTLGKLAKRYGTTVREIQRANGLKSTLIQAKKRYRIPQQGPAPESDTPVTIPPRRLPPPKQRPPFAHAPERE